MTAPGSGQYGKLIGKVLFPTSGGSYILKRELAVTA